MAPPPDLVVPLHFPTAPRRDLRPLLLLFNFSLFLNMPMPLRPPLDPATFKALLYPVIPIKQHPDLLSTIRRHSRLTFTTSPCRHLTTTTRQHLHLIFTIRRHLDTITIILLKTAILSTLRLPITLSTNTRRHGHPLHQRFKRPPQARLLLPPLKSNPT